MAALGDREHAPIFDRIVVIDWSAASVPRLGQDSIWLAIADRAGITLENVPTRAACEHRVSALVAAVGDQRTLLGVDFSLGYPAGTSAAFGLAGTPWRAMWGHLAEVVADDDRNRNNRFVVAAELNRRLGGADGPFWGRPATQAIRGLPATKPPPRTPTTSPAEWRVVEETLRAAGRRPFSAWQLLGAGCVGSQTLVGLPVLERMRVRFGGRVRVWPLSTGLTVPVVRPGDVVVAEVWPTLVDVDPRGGQVRDAAQVEVVAGRLADLDRAGSLAPHFAPAVGDDVAAAVVAEEGWVLGVGVPQDAERDGLAAAARH